MRLFLDEIVARVVAIYLFIDCSREFRNALAEGRIRYFNPDPLNWLLLSDSPIYKDASPIRYWIEIGVRAVLLIACLVVAIFGWWRPAS